MKKSIKFLWIGLVCSILGFNLLLFCINAGWLGYMPKMEELENPKSATASELYAEDNSKIGKFFLENREPIRYSEISKNVVDALVATEDERFYKHSGIDAEAIGRAIFGVLTFNRKGGASTITQQLAKHLLEQEQRSKNVFMVLIEKLKEQIVAVKLEKNLTKQEILTLYLNTVPWGYNSFGINSAAKTYFNKKPIDLNVEESALLIGMLKGSSLYNPVRHPERATERRNTVIDQMVKNFKISASEAQLIKDRPIVLDFSPTSASQHEGVAPYFRQVVEQKMLVWCKKKGYNLYKDGLKIYTSLDTTMQQYAEEAVAKQMYGKTRFASAAKWANHPKTLKRAVRESERYKGLKAEGMSEEDIMKNFNTKTRMKVFAWNAKREKDTTITPLDSIKYMKGFVQTGFLVMDPATGEVKAWVGGINHKYFQFDHVNENTKRQVGSTIKPLLYCLAVDNGYSPCQSISLNPVMFPGHGWYGPDKSRGAMPMKMALAHSKNNATVNILKLVGINAFVDFVRKVGIISSNIHAYPSVCLGADDISIIEMLRSYTMFPNYGINTEPIYITRIEDRNGNLLENFVPKRTEVINEITAFKMIRMMMGTVLFGTGRRLKPGWNIKGECAGKTGTTNSESDAWFIGYTPQLLAGAWVGCDDKFIGVGLGEGARAAMPIWGEFFKKLQANEKSPYNKVAKFEMPVIMEGMDECDAVDEISLQRANAQMNVSRGLPEEDEPGETGWDDGNTNSGIDDKDY
ncbi:MAG: transglycosylase domain-containing protein [Bacteroidetes bacterium]|nr:transglycosylase domain-containing protein [Bacteroidota bacterium]MBP6314547.1 transglycosylase domain-containing protein [Chitinophagaceae bacterium]